MSAWGTAARWGSKANQLKDFVPYPNVTQWAIHEASSHPERAALAGVSLYAFGRPAGRVMMRGGRDILVESFKYKGKVAKHSLKAFQLRNVPLRIPGPLRTIGRSVPYVMAAMTAYDAVAIVHQQSKDAPRSFSDRRFNLNF